MLDQCWSTVYAAGPTVVKYWLNVLCLLGERSLCIVIECSRPIDDVMFFPNSVKRSDVTGSLLNGYSVKTMVDKSPFPILHCIGLLGENIAGQCYWVSQNHNQSIKRLLRLNPQQTELRGTQIFSMIMWYDTITNTSPRRLPSLYWHCHSDRIGGLKYDITTEWRSWLADIVMWQAKPLFDWSGVEYQNWTESVDTFIWNAVTSPETVLKRSSVKTKLYNTPSPSLHCIS